MDIELGVAIAGGFFLVFLLVFGHWVIYNFFEARRRGWDEACFLARCGVCSFVFFEYRGLGIYRCPRCKSLISRTDKGEDSVNGRNNEKGFLLLTVIALIMAMSIIMIGIMSIHVSQVISGGSVVRHIEAEELAKGAAARYHQAQITGNWDTISWTHWDATGVNWLDSVTVGATNVNYNDTSLLQVSIPYLISN